MKYDSQDASVLISSKDVEFSERLCRELERTGVGTTRWTPSATESDVPRREYQILVLDADLPPESTDTIMAAIREVSPSITIYAVASEPTVELLLNLIRIGVYHFEQKPVRIPEFASAVRVSCQRSLIRSFSAEVFDRLKRSESLLDRSQVELHEEIVKSNEELQLINKKLQKVVTQVKTLYHMGRDLAENENWSDALDRFLMALVNFMGAEGAALLMFSRGTSVLAPRSTFQIGHEAMAKACAQIVSKWNRHTRSSEIHSLESYNRGKYTSCLEETSPWRRSIIPLKHRNQPLGFLVLEKEYQNGFNFKSDYDFLSTLQTIFVEEIANASYISELRHLSRFNKKVLDNIRSGVITTNSEGAINYSNEWARGMCPVLRGSAQKEVHFNDIFTSRQFSKNFFERVLKSQKNSYILEVDCSGAKGEAFPARLRTTKMYDDNLNGMVIVAIFEDLTEQRRLEAEVRRNDRLRVLGQLSAGVAHEIRNPLTGIATSAEVLAGKLGKDEDKAKYIRAIMDEINRLNGIIRNLLDFARPPKPRIAPCSLPEVVDRVFSLLADEAARKGVVLEANEKPEVLYCEADPGQLSQVLLNIVLNAIQACGKGDKVKLDVTRGKAADPAYAKTVRIDVIDSGPGVPKEIRGSLFDPFVTTKSRGTGLGLAISQQIMEEHQGRITCEFLDRGTRFSIHLPQTEPKEPDKHGNNQ